jgi:hypothetical protein
VTMTTRFTMRQAITDPTLFANHMQGPSWSRWRVILIAAMGEELTPAERETFKRLSGRDHEPGARVDELWGIVGRRGGKSRAASVLAAYLAGCCTFSGLAAGERPRVLCLAQNRDTASVVLQYVEGLFDSVPALAKMVVNRTAESLSLNNGIDIEVRSASFRGLRGVTSIAVIADECAFWYSDDTGSKNTDSEILNAVRPSLATTGGPLIVISSPHGKFGEVYSAFADHYGEKGDPKILVVNGPTRAFNPSLPQSVVDRAMARDPELNRAEYLGQFRDDVSGFITRAALDACVAHGRNELPPLPDVKYSAFVDAAGGSGGDSFTLGIAHCEASSLAVLDLVRERRPPFSPAEVVVEFCSEIARYRCGFVVGDRYASEILAEQFRAKGLGYRPSERTKSEIYLDVLPLLNSGQVELLDHPRLIGQLAALERATARSGKSTVDHPRNGRDDVANAASGAIVNAVGYAAPEFIWGGIPLPGGKAAAREREEARQFQDQDPHVGLATRFNGGDMRSDLQSIGADYFSPRFSNP